MNKTRIKVEIKSEHLTKKKQDLIERMMMDIGFVLIKHFEKVK